MKKNIHPAYYSEAAIACACGNVLAAGSTKKKIAVEVCSACHPFYTGQARYIDVRGRVERFQAKQEKAKKYVRKQKIFAEKQSAPRSLKEMLVEAKKKAK